MPVVPHKHTYSMHQTAPPKGSCVQKCKRIWSATITSHVQTMSSDVGHCGSSAGSAWVALFRMLFVSLSCTPSSQNEADVRKTAAHFSNSCSPSAFGTGLASYTTYHLFPSTTSSIINIKSPACIMLAAPYTRTCAQHQQKPTCSATHTQLLWQPNWQSQWRSFKEV